MSRDENNQLTRGNFFSFYFRCARVTTTNKLILTVLASLIDLLLSVYSSGIVDTLNSILASVKVTLTHVQCKIWYCYSVAEVASLIKILCDSAYENTNVWTEEQWVNRHWVQETFSAVRLVLFYFWN